MITQAEKDLISRLEKLYEEGKKYRENWSSKWDRFADRRRGKHWDSKLPSHRVDAVMNFLNQIIERKTAIMTDSRPIIQVVPRRKDLQDVADSLSIVCGAIFEEHDWERSLTELIELDQTFGIVGVNTCWDPSLDEGQGDIDLVVLDPRSFVFDPFVTRSWQLRSGEYFILEYVRPTDYLRDLCPDRADDIKPDFASSTLSDDSVIGKIKSFIYNTSPSSSTRKSSVIPRSVVRQYWFRDRNTKNPDGTPVYPNWRYVIVAGGCIIDDGPNPYIDGHLPFDIMDWTFNVDSPYGYSEVDLLDMPQRMFNKVIATIIENALSTSNGIWIGDKEALSDDQWMKLSNAPGLIVQKRRGFELRRDPGVPLPAYIMQLPNLILSGMEKLSGITEVTEGRKPGSVASGQAIEQLQVAAQTAIRLKARQLEGLIQRVGQKLISRIFQYYTEDRVFNIMGSDHRFTQYVFQRSEIRNKLAAASSDIHTAFRDFTFRVVPSSSLSVTKWQRGLIAMQLYNSGIIDDKEVLEVLEWPSAERVLERTTQKKMVGILPVRQPTRQKLPKQLLRAHPERGLQMPQK